MTLKRNRPNWFVGMARCLGRSAGKYMAGYPNDPIPVARRSQSVTVDRGLSPSYAVEKMTCPAAPSAVTRSPTPRALVLSFRSARTRNRRSCAASRNHSPRPSRRVTVNCQPMAGCGTERLAFVPITITSTSTNVALLVLSDSGARARNRGSAAFRFTHALPPYGVR